MLEKSKNKVKDLKFFQVRLLLKHFKKKKESIYFLFQEI